MTSNTHKKVKFMGQWHTAVVIPTVRPDARISSSVALSFIHGPVTRASGRQSSNARPYTGDLATQHSNA